MVGAALLWGFGAWTSSADELQVVPSQLFLSGTGVTHGVLVLEREEQELRGGISERALQLRSANPGIAAVEGLQVTAVAPGKTELHVSVLREDGQVRAEAVVPIEVGQEAVDRVPSFRHEVQSVLAKAGCNSGACHGALAGKGGFRLSLRGYDADADWVSITRDVMGRRINLAAPQRSLLLTKPTGALPHKGGLRLNLGSRDYRVLAGWIAAGAPGPIPDDPYLERIVVEPAAARLEVGAQQRLLVQAFYSDGRVVDATAWAKFSASDESVATVDENGIITVRGPGVGAIVAWFGSQIALARVRVPFDSKDSVVAQADDRPRNFIDQSVQDQLTALRLSASPRCSDAEFIRRVMLDTIGVLPTLAEVESFVSSTEADKRDTLIDQVLNRPEFVDYWAYKWSDLLLVTGTKLRPAAVKSFYSWIREQVAANTPWDEFVRQILTATGDALTNGSTNFYALHQDPENLSENACQAFLGLSVNCAKCHNHPLEKWTNDQYYAMANLFARVRSKGWGGDPRNGDGRRTVYVAATGELIQPRRGVPQLPTPLDGVPLAFDDPRDRREHMADWMVSPQNPYFARAISNRVWANFMGIGLVEQVDDMRLSNPASNEQLLSALAQHLVEQKFDLKSLMRTILQAKTYQRSSQVSPQNAAETRFYSRYYPRRLMAEVLLDAVDGVLETRSQFSEIAFPGADKEKTDFYPAGTRAVQLYDSAVDSYFLTTFGRNPRDITCECERSAEPSMVQVLHLSNGNTINDKLCSPDNRIGRLMREGKTDEQVIEELFLAALARRPTASEQQRLQEVVREYPEMERRQALEDVAWSVLSSAEFLFNH
jgi:hypothetical protein